MWCGVVEWLVVLQCQKHYLGNESKYLRLKLNCLKANANMVLQHWFLHPHNTVFKLITHIYCFLIFCSQLRLIPPPATTTTTPTFIVFFSPSNESLSRQHIFNLFGEHFYDSSFIFKIPAKNSENPEGRNGIKNLNSRHLKLRRVPSFSLEWRTESIENSATHGELSPITWAANVSTMFSDFISWCKLIIISVTRCWIKKVAKMLPKAA